MASTLLVASSIGIADINEKTTSQAILLSPEDSLVASTLRVFAELEGDVPGTTPADVLQSTTTTLPLCLAWRC
jgi:hypothetical protein